MIKSYTSMQEKENQDVEEYNSKLKILQLAVNSRK